MIIPNEYKQVVEGYELVQSSYLPAPTDDAVYALVKDADLARRWPYEDGSIITTYVKD